MILPLKQEKNYQKNEKKQAMKTKKECTVTSQTLFKTANKERRV